MEDVIYRQAAIEAIDAVFPVDPMKSEYTQGIACGAALAKTYVEQLPSAQQWIPCSERLPEEGHEVLFSTKTGTVQIGKYSDRGCLNSWFSYCDKCRARNNVVNAWMPLPEPYEDKHED